MATEWKWRIMLFARATDNTAAARTSFAEILAAGSGETVQAERGLFDSTVKLSISGNLPAQVLGINTAVKPTMRTGLLAFLDTLSQSRYYVVMNTTTDGNFDGKLVLDNKVDVGGTTLVDVPPWDTTPFTFADALADLLAERGLHVIPDEDTLL